MHILYTLNNNHTCLTFSWVPADMPAGLKKSYGQPHYFQILSTFLYDFVSAVGWLTYYSMPLYTVIYGLYLAYIIHLLYIISYNMSLKVLIIVCNVFHYHINKRKEFVR